MKYEVKNYSHLKNIGKISDEAMQMHFKLYEGYVKNTNTLLEKFDNLRTVDNDTMAKNLPEWTEMHRRFGWEFNGMRLHELFFDSLTVDVSPSHGEGGANAPEGVVLIKIEENFGNVETWKKEFYTLAKMRGMGWAMLVQDLKTGKLINTWVNEHDAGMLGDVKIILNVDMFEHAFVKDFGTDRQPYLDSIFSHIDWAVVSERLI
jgi:Fe-Mn family superoxide dismutase